MPNVAHVWEQQGFRPRTSRKPALRGMRGLGSGASTTWDAPPAVPPANCSTWDFFFNSTAWKACQAASEQAQIQSVAANAAYYYGPNSSTAQVAQETADQQSAQASADVQNVASYYGAGQMLYNPQNQTSLPTWAWAAIALGALVLLK